MFRSQYLVLVLPLGLLLVAYTRAYFSYYRDPTSIFFDHKRAYNRSYSEIRKTEAIEFIKASTAQSSKRTSNTPPLFCIGIPTVSRPGGHIYVRETIGSLLAGLDGSERDAIHLMPFIGHSDPSLHPIYNESWLHNVADQILTYNTLDTIPNVDLDHIAELELNKENREKQVFDYAYMLQACLQINASYVVTFEDDILALDGWFHRAKAAVDGIEDQIKSLGISPFFYLRLFYTEQYLGWNAEFWPYYLFYSIIISFTVLSLVYAYLRKMQYLQRSTRQILVGTLAYCAIAIGFFFACGRVSMLPQAQGIQQMPRFACCAQGLVYNRVWVPRLVDWYHERRLGFVDNLAEELAETGEVGTRWALTPSVVQHAGTYSTKGEVKEEFKDGVSISEQRWNFAFELNNAGLLKAEHVEAVAKEGSRL